MRSWSPLPFAGLLVSLAAAVLIVAVAYAGARTSSSWSDPLFWVGLVVLFVPCALRLTGRRASRAERLWLVILVSLALYAVKVLLEPHGFTLHDELGQYRSVSDILRTGRLYVANPVVSAYAYYPGMLSVTAAISKLSGLGIFTSGVILIAVARVLLAGGLFLAFERVARSPRIAGLAAIVYAANPNFMFFDSAFAYESLALGLGAMTLWAAARVLDEDDRDRAALPAAAVLDAALVLTHHLTSYAVAIAIVVWALFETIRRRSLREAARLAILPLLCGAMTAAYAIWSWPATQSDIGGSITGSIHGLITVITGQASGKHPFAAAPGYPNPVLEQAVGILSVALLLVALPWGLYTVLRRRPVNSGLVMLALCAALYPVTLALRLTGGGSETSNRTSEFVFAGLGAVLAVAFMARIGSHAISRRVTRIPARVLASIYLGLVFVGGITVGNPPYQLIPGDFQVGASNRSVDAEGVAAARWGRRLPAGTRFLSNETDAELFSAYTRLVAQRGSFDGTGIGLVFTSPTLGPEERRIIHFDKLRFLIVDRRDSTALPASGSYFEEADPVSSYAHPIPLKSLTKFGRNPCIQKIFTSGNVVVYDTSPLLRGCR